MKKGLTIALTAGALVLTLIALNMLTERRRLKVALDDPLYMGVMNGNTGEYIYISEKKNIAQITDELKNMTMPVFNTEGYSYYIDVFSSKSPGDTMRYTIGNTTGSIGKLLENFYTNSKSYKKDRIYEVQNISLDRRYEIKLRYTGDDSYTKSNEVITVSNLKAMEQIIETLKAIRLKYDTYSLEDGAKKCWVQLCYNNKQILHEEFSGNKVIRNDEEYVVANPNSVNDLYSYIKQLQGN